MAKKSKKIVPEESSFSHHYGMILGAIVAIVAVVALVILLSGELTGQASGFTNIPQSACTSECGPGFIGKPMGHKGSQPGLGIGYCLCKKI